MFTTPWISRLTAVLLLIATLAAAYVFVAEPIVAGYRETDRHIEDVREQLSHFQRLAAIKPALAKQLEQAEAQQTSQGHYLIGGTDALAAAGLQDRVSALIERTGGSLRSIQPMPGTDEQGFRRITLRVQMSGTIEALFETLYALEAGTPALFVGNLDIQSRFIRQKSNQADIEKAPDAPLLTVGFDLFGYLPIEAQ
ncbi:MAG: type II secretion system protein GspM [Dongiaceae bacterium]